MDFPLLQPGLGGAFVRDGFGAAPPFTATGQALQGLRLGVKDVFQVEGLRMGAGVPAWASEQRPACESAPAVRQCLQAGARWVGKTVTDELAFSLAGINHHYGMPVNAAAPGRLPGGSSSGSAAAVAAGDVDIALGTDCGGSCRLPASYCGVWGLRPTQGRLAGGGFTLAPSFDTVGWFAREGADMARVFEVLAGEAVPAIDSLPPLLVAEDTLRACDAGLRTALVQDLERLQWPRRWLAAGELPLAHWAQAHRLLQGAEIWEAHGEWVDGHAGALGPDVQARFDGARQAAQADLRPWQVVRGAATRLLAQLLEEGALLLLPTVPGPAPWRGEDAQALELQRGRAQQLLCLAGLAGLPQVSFPWRRLDGAPAGLSLIGPRGQDARVLAAALWCAPRLAAA
ncbi:MAG: amidase [Burkholderiaceae bacterium]|nr:amidase [Burkholderiaceae bacterium]